MYSEKQKTRWFSAPDLPSLPGKYELREKGSDVIFHGLYADGQWSVAFGEPTYKKLNVAHSRLQWRGLNADPRTLPNHFSVEGPVKYFGFRRP